MRETNVGRKLNRHLASREYPPMPAAYRFLDRWVVASPATGDEAPPEPGKRNELLVKAYLPYKVNFGLEVLEAERPRRIFSRLSKDFDGTGEWTLTETADGTVATLDWRPLFRSNHNWAMRHGERQIHEYLHAT